MGGGYLIFLLFKIFQVVLGTTLRGGCMIFLFYTVFQEDFDRFCTTFECGKLEFTILTSFVYWNSLFWPTLLVAYCMVHHILVHIYLCNTCVMSIFYLLSFRVFIFCSVLLFFVFPLFSSLDYFQLISFPIRRLSILYHK